MLALLTPSLALVEKYSGLQGVALYIVLGFVALYLCFRLFLRAGIAGDITRLISSRQAGWLLIFSLIAAAVLFVVLYPIAQVGGAGGGSDGDDALNIAASAMMHGRYPYYEQTYLGNAISPLPGAILLSLPFVLLGTSAYQNIFWLGLYILALYIYFKDSRYVLMLVWLVFVFCPSFWHVLITGGDYIANSLYVLLLVWLAIHVEIKDKATGASRILAPLLLGIGLSSRFNFLLVVPIFFSYLVQRSGWRHASMSLALCSLSFGLITFPFMLYDWQGFSPLHAYNDKLGVLDQYIPFAGYIILACAGLLPIYLALPRFNNRLEHVFRNCALIQAFPILAGTLFASLGTAKLDLGYTYFGIFYLFFTVTAFWIGYKAGQK